LETTIPTFGNQHKTPSSYHPQSNGGQEKFNKTLIEALRTYVSHRQDNWDECLLYFEFTYNNSVNPSTGLSPFILSYAQSPHSPWQFLDTYVALDEASPVDVSEAQKGSDAQLASYLGLDIINNVCESRDSLHRMADNFRVRNARLVKPHSFKAGDSVLLSTKHINLSLPCRKLSPAFVGPFSIRDLCGTNTVILNYSERVQLLNPKVNIEYLRSYFRRNGVGLTTSQLFINNTPIMTQSLEPHLIYNENLITLGNNHSDMGIGVHPGCISLAHFLKYYFCHIVSLENISPRDGFYKSGLDGKVNALNFN
jgi:hypothetical protein